MAESQQQINQGSQQCSNPGFMPGGQNQSIQGELMKTSKTTRGIKSTTARNDRRNARWTK